MSGFSPSVFIAPVGFVDSDVLAESQQLTEFGLFVKQDSSSLLVGLDVTTGFGGEWDGRSFQGSLLSLPTIGGVVSVPFALSPAVPIWSNIGVGAGLTRFHEATLQTVLDGLPTALDVRADGFHAAFTYGLSTYLGGSLGVFVDGSVRYTVLPSVKYFRGDDQVTPPSASPTSLRFTYGTLRFGVGVG